MKVERPLASSDPDLPYEVPMEIRDAEDDDVSDLFEKKRKPKRRRPSGEEEGK